MPALQHQPQPGPQPQHLPDLLQPCWSRWPDKLQSKHQLSLHLYPGLGLVKPPAPNPPVLEPSPALGLGWTNPPPPKVEPAVSGAPGLPCLPAHLSQGSPGCWPGLLLLQVCAQYKAWLLSVCCPPVDRGRVGGPVPCAAAVAPKVTACRPSH